MRTASLICALSWAGLIYYLSDQPGLDTEQLFQHQDKMMHVIAYGVLGIFCMGALKKAVAGYSLRQVWVVTLLTGAYGLLDEFHQSFIPGRFSTASDVVADLAGGFLGALAMYLLARKFAGAPVSP